MYFCFVTRNRGKVREFCDLVPDDWEVQSLEDLDVTGEAREDGTTLEQNSILKAKWGWERICRPVIADDTGLEVEALEGKPGVRSARLALDEGSDGSNVDCLLELLGDSSNRRAQFKTVVSVFLGKSEFRQFTGSVAGAITGEIRGSGGFGYDGVFLPDGFDRTFAEMSLKDKNRISHRYKAMRKLVDYFGRLHENNPKNRDPRIPSSPVGD